MNNSYRWMCVKSNTVKFAVSMLASAHLVAGRRTLSLVDCVNFEIMRRTGVRTAFGFDRHFREYGYDLIPK